MPGFKSQPRPLPQIRLVSLASTKQKYFENANKPQHFSFICSLTKPRRRTQPRSKPNKPCTCDRECYPIVEQVSAGKIPTPRELSEDERTAPTMTLSDRLRGRQQARTATNSTPLRGEQMFAKTTFKLGLHIEA